MSSTLFSQINIDALCLPNRIVVSPMCQYSATEGDLAFWHNMHYGTLAVSGAGLMIVEATAVSPEGRITPKCLGLYTDAHQQAFATLIQEIRAVSPVRIGIQIGHAGRKASCQIPWKGGKAMPLDQGGWQTIAPSALAMNEGDTCPTAMSLEDIEQVIQKFALAATRAKQAGFDLIELHGAHGYLLHQFLSPLSNTRTDQYGGSLENRMRFPLEVFSAMKQAVGPDMPLGIRLSATDWMDDGWEPEQCATLCARLEQLGCAFFDISSGGLSATQKIVLGPGYQVDFAARIKQTVKAPVFAVGLITEAAQAEQILTQEKADAIALARALLYNPRWPWHAAVSLEAKAHMPPQYWAGLPRKSPRIYSTD